MAATFSLFGERSLTLVAAAFNDRQRAETAASILKEDPALYGQVSIVQPGESHVGRKLEPENRGIWRTLVRSHVVLGAGGLLVGLAVAAALIAWPWAAAAGSPGFTALFCGVMGAFVGGMLGGLVTLRPDHGVVIRQVRDRLAHGQCAVVVHPLSEGRAKEAFDILQGAGGSPVRSL